MEVDSIRKKHKKETRMGTGGDYKNSQKRDKKGYSDYVGENGSTRESQLVGKGGARDSPTQLSMGS